MDSVATSRSRKKSKGKADASSIGSRRIWTKREELFLISAMRDLCNNPKWKRQPSVSSMQNKSFPYYEDWLVLFGKDRATGELAKDPADAVEAIAVEEAMGEKGDGSPAKQFNVADFECSMSTNGNASNSSTFSKGGTKRARTTEGIASNIATITETLSSFLDKTDTRLGEIVKRIGYQHDLSKLGGVSMLNF
ncbi:hypothetical protein LOK49_LG09G00302 [Camellia lanceoleosa]|uniref:Uncharacterized protein n=1 Tax=Camellia lanceoleosa TaxID=1840588 RepID=A0ACC0GNG6_9ERIC|nr:hypothetical protein LOK49_LG09G00302 [Camellia lanceoleosa]